jgi:hypothetical protein
MSNLGKLTSCTIFNKAVGAGFTNSLKTLKSNLCKPAPLRAIGCLGRVYQNCIVVATLSEKPAPTNLLMRMVQKMNFNNLFLTNILSADAPL